MPVRIIRPSLLLMLCFSTHFASGQAQWCEPSPSFESLPSPLAGNGNCGSNCGGDTSCLSNSSCGYAANELGGQLCQPCQPRSSSWYVSAAGLIMGRDEPSRVWTTYETNNNPNQLMDTGDVYPDWNGGIETHIGCQARCCTWGVDLGYWTIDDLEAYGSQTHANSVSTPLLFNDLEFGMGDPVQDYYNGAGEHRLTRRNRVHNVELNLIESTSPCQSCGPWQNRNSIGLRYFRFDEDLTFATLDLGGTWGANAGVDEAYMEESIENHLLGAQIGCHLDRRCGQRASFFLAPKVGVYNNRIEHRFHLRRGDGVEAMPTVASGVTGSYPIESSRDVISFLTELNVGFAWQPTCRWSLFGGYRVVALTGMGLADSQIPQYIVDIPEIADIDHQSSLLLHGAFFGLSCQL